ncbi:hypothetical protein ACFXIV_48300, partial [Nocardia sp. NPDC059236]
MTGTSYGQLLMVKVLLVGVLVSVGWFSRRWTTRLTESPAAASASARGATVPTRRSPEGVTARTSARSAPEAPAGQQAGTTDPVRAAQLARQRAAADAARERQEREADPQRSGLRRSVLTEAAVAVVLLAVTTALTGTEPGRTEEQVRAATDAARNAPGGPVDVKVPFDTGGPD